MFLTKYKYSCNFKFRQRRKMIYVEYYHTEKRKNIIYTADKNRNNGSGLNLLGYLRQNNPGIFSADLPCGTRVIHIQFSLNCRLIAASAIFCCRFTGLAEIPGFYIRNHKRTRCLIKQWKIESNQYDNLSPPALCNNDLRFSTHK